MFAEKRRLYGFSRGTEIPWGSEVERGIGRGVELVLRLFSLFLVWWLLGSMEGSVWYGLDVADVKIPQDRQRRLSETLLN